MDDRFLYQLRRDPDPAYAARLRAQLRRSDHPRAAWRWRPALAAVAASIAIVSLFVFPSMRASAQAVLDLFRVRNFTAVQFDPARLEKLHDQAENNTLPMFGTREMLQDPGKPAEVATPQAASAVAGIDVRVPSDLPDGMTLRKVVVEGAGAARFTADAAKLRALLEALDIRDLEVPPAIDGKTLTVRKPPIVLQEYRSDRRHAVLAQARSPEVDLPPGADLARLAEIGMRILGVDRTQAHRLATSIDWHTTLLVPVPMDASSFRGVEVHGQPGLLVTSSGRKNAAGKGEREGTLVLWSEADRVFAIQSDLSSFAVMQLAESVR